MNSEGIDLLGVTIRRDKPLRMSPLKKQELCNRLGMSAFQADKIGAKDLLNMAINEDIEELVRLEKRQSLSAEDRKRLKATVKLWFDNNVPEQQIGRSRTARVDSYTSGSGETIRVTKSFFDDTAHYNSRNNDYAQLMQIAIRYKEWGRLSNLENPHVPPRHNHPYDFSSYSVNFAGRNIVVEVANLSDGKQMHFMRFK